MKVLKIAGLAIGALVLIFILVGLIFLPREVTVSRSIVVNAPTPVVFDHASNLERFVEWNPWAAMDPQMEVSYGPIRSGEGASYSWIGPESGEGTLTNREVIENKKIVQDINFGPQGGGVATWTFEETEGGLKATWRFDTDLGYNPMQRWFGLILPGMLGAQYEKGLQNMKDSAEGTR